MRALISFSFGSILLLLLMSLTINLPKFSRTNYLGNPNAIEETLESLLSCLATAVDTDP